MKNFYIEDAIGKKIGHELTGIIPGSETKIIFSKGHIITIDDVEVLKNMGKYEIFVLDENSFLIHENEGAQSLGIRGIGSHLTVSEPKEGKVFITSKKDGLLIVDIARLKAINLIDGLMVSTKRNYSAVKNGDKVAAFGIKPLEIEETIVKEGLAFLSQPLVSVKPFYQMKVGLIITGTEIYSGRTKDAFYFYVDNKIKPYGSFIAEQLILPDDKKEVKDALDSFLKDKFDIIILTGGMSVDASDITKEVIREIDNIEIIVHGSPVLPGAMFMVAYHQDTPVIGLPAGVLRDGPSIFDIVLPILLAKEKITKDYIASLANGGLLLIK